MFAALTEDHGDLREKVNTFVALAPVVYLNNIGVGFINDFATHFDDIIWWLDSLNIFELFGEDWKVA